MKNLSRLFHAIGSLPAANWALAALIVFCVAAVLKVIGWPERSAAATAEPAWWEASPPPYAIPVHVACPGIAFEGWRNPDRTGPDTFFTLAGELVHVPIGCTIIFRKPKP